MRQQNNSRECGVITVEATISLTAFVFAMVMILSVTNICIVQAKVANAINMTAKELSQYCYLYSLTGFNKTEAELKEQADSETESLKTALNSLNTVFNEIQKIGETGKTTPNNVDDIMTTWESIAGSASTIEESKATIEKEIAIIANEPKNLIFGIAKLAASETLEVAKSKLIAAPLAKVMCQKHLVTKEGASPETLLKSLGVVPDATGSYIGGLDFGESTLFPYGSNEITINVTYDVKVIALLPIDWTFHFNQTAITHGWLGGEVSFKGSKKYIENDSLWTQATVKERSSLIRHLVIADMTLEGYAKVSKMTNIHLYNASKNQFMTVASMNPLYTAPDEEPITVADLDDEEMQAAIEKLCGNMKAVTDGETKVVTKTENSDGSTTKKEHNCTNASNKIMLVIPEDEGLKEYIEGIIEKSNTRGVIIEVAPSFGIGAPKSEVTEGDAGTETE